MSVNNDFFNKFIYDGWRQFFYADILSYNFSEFIEIKLLPVKFSGFFLIFIYFVL